MRQKISHYIVVVLALLLVVDLLIAKDKNLLGLTHEARASDLSEDVFHGFYPATTSFTKDIESYIEALDSISFAWGRIDEGYENSLNTVKGKNNNYGFYYPSDYKLPIQYAKEKGKFIQLSIYMDGKDGIKLLPYPEKRTTMVQSIMDVLKTEIMESSAIYYDGVVIDFEGLRDSNQGKEAILYENEPISAHFMKFLEELKIELEKTGQTLLVAVNPLIYFDGYNYDEILDISDKLILMAHDYEPTEKLTKQQVMQYQAIDNMNPIHSLAPFNQVRMALEDLKQAANDKDEMSKVWLQLSFDIAQWQFDVKKESAWNTLSNGSYSRRGRVTPLYSALKSRIDNKDGNGSNLIYGYNNELQSPYLQYYNKADQSMNIMIYEDSNSIQAKMDLGKAYGIGGISIWSLGNVPNYNDSNSMKYHLNVWETIINGIREFDDELANTKSYITFQDKTVEEAVRQKIGKATGKISVYDVEQIYRLKLPTGVKTVKDLSKFKNLEYLDAKGLGIKDISSLSSLKNLQILNLANNAINDGTSLKNLTKLTYLDLSNNKIKSTTFLKKLTKLKTLYLQRNSVTDISSLSSLTKLQVLSLNGNKVAELKPLAKLKSLQKLYLKENQISSVTQLKSLTKLNELYLSGNKIKSYTALKTIASKKNFMKDFIMK